MGAVIGVSAAACSKAVCSDRKAERCGGARNGVSITRASLKRVEKFGQFAGTALTDRSAVEQLISEEIIRQQAGKLHVTLSAKSCRRASSRLPRESVGWPPSSGS